MKRHSALETLSFEHHDALVVALRIKKGLMKNAELNTILEYCLAIYKKHLRHHFKQEEESLVGPLKALPETQPALQQVLEEHQQFAITIDQLEKRTGDLKALLKEFAQLLETHIRFEERTLFPLDEQHLSQEQLQKIGEYLHQEHQPIDKSWPEEFWKD